jgi:hypothetical protein
MRSSELRPRSESTHALNARFCRVVVAPLLVGMLVLLGNPAGLLLWRHSVRRDPRARPTVPPQTASRPGCRRPLLLQDARSRMVEDQSDAGTREREHVSVALGVVDATYCVDVGVLELCHRGL